MTDTRDHSAVDRFAARMHAKLSEPRCVAKGHWAGCTPSYLLGLLRDEMRELVGELTAPTLEPERVVGECVDVANVAMMIADVLGGLPEAPTPAEVASGDGDRWLKRVKTVETRVDLAQLALRGDLAGLRAALDLHSPAPPGAVHPPPHDGAGSAVCSPNGAAT